MDHELKSSNVAPSCKEGIKNLLCFYVSYVKVRENLESAIAKYKIEHPVCNDSQSKLWTETGVFCWPTLLILSPDARPLLVLIGEKVKDKLFAFVKVALEYFNQDGRVKFDGGSLHQPDDLKSDREPTKPLDRLSFPGKVAAHGTKLFVADSGNNRVLAVGRDTGLVEQGKFVIFRDDDIVGFSFLNYLFNTWDHAWHSDNLL